ncbi:hypothetical protein BOX15_Mlig010981g3 [Macrostomum lignano]|uniref:Uncharacterized protein n=2 Tax=Macrostomum lignano TaxID=282301 RepID=A0A267DVH8_9PLAT|nr:hypothetical protein BOX15_Mlig010981g3 [Macrostomum lignano]
MSNLFESISTRSELEIAPTDLYHDQRASSSKASAPVVTNRNEDSRVSINDKRPVKRDLLSFMSQKVMGTSSVERKVSDVHNSAVQRKLSGAEELDRTDHTSPADTQCEKPDNDHNVCNADSHPSRDVFGQDVIHFLSEEYGSTYQSQLDMSAIMNTTLAQQKECFESRTVSGSSDLAAVQTSPPVAPISQTESTTVLRNCAGASASDSHVETDEFCAEDSESSLDALNIISAVESFSSAIDQETEDGVSFMKKPKTTLKPSKIEFSVSQSTSTYHKWKSSVSVPEELVRKLPKPAVQPRLPPELAQSHSGPHVLKSSLNIDFKKQATTKAELRFNSLTVEKQDCPSIRENPPDESKREKPPVKLVIKTLSRESKPQRVVIVSCSSSVRRETTNHSNDDSDSDSCGRNSTSYGATQANQGVSAPVSQSQASTEKNSGSSTTNQGGTEQSRSLCFCSMQPVVKISAIDSMAPPLSDKVLSFRSSAPSTWGSLQDLFHRACIAQQPSGKSQTSVALKAQTATDKKTKSMQSTPAELKRLSDSTGFCAFANIPDKRESTKIAALYQHALLAQSQIRQKDCLRPDSLLADNLTEVQKSMPPKSKSAVRKETSRMLISNEIFSSKKHSNRIRRQIRDKRRSKFRHLRAVQGFQVQPPKFVNKEPRAHKHIKPKQLDPLVAASFRRGTEEPTVDHFGRSSLHIAMDTTDEATLNFVVNVYKENDDLDCKDNEGLTPLMLACRNGNSKAASLLLSAGASSSETFPVSGNTLLHEAVLQSNLPLVKSLVDFGADLTTKNAKGFCAMDLSTSTEISEFLRPISDYCLRYESSKIRIIHSERKLPTIYLLSLLDDHGVKGAPCVIKSELCNSLGVSPEYFDVHYSGKMTSHVMDNSVILGRIINPHLKESFELSTRTSSSTTLIEVNEFFFRMFHEYTFSEKRSRTHTEQQQPNQQIEQNSSSDTDEMTDDHLSEQDECEIRRDDVQEIHRSLKKFTFLERKRRAKQNQRLVKSSSFSSNGIADSTEKPGLNRRDTKPADRTSETCPVVETGMIKISAPTSTSTVSESSAIASFSLESSNISVKSEPIEIPASEEEQQFVSSPEQLQRKKCASRVRFVTPRAGYRLQSSATKVPEVSRVETISKASECFSDTSEEADLSFYDANLDFNDSASITVPAIRTSRRKANPLTSLHAEKSPRYLVGESKSVSISIDQTQSASQLFKQTSSVVTPVSETKASPLNASVSKSAPETQTQFVERDAPTSVFRVNVLPRVGSLTKQFHRTSESVFPCPRFHKSKILGPSAMVRILKPTIEVSHETKDPAQGLRASLSTVASIPSTSKSHVTVLQGSDQLPSKGNLQDQGSRLFVKGQFRPVRVVVSPASKAASRSDAPI